MFDRNALTHERVWAAIDALAERHNMTTSGLARRAGLDPTTFNRSKRMAGDRPRWPSTESIAKILEATGSRADEFFALSGVATYAGARGGWSSESFAFVPLTGIPGYPPGFSDDSGHRDEIPVPTRYDTALYALEVIGDGMLPLYRDGDLLIVAPGAPARRGDRVIIHTVDGTVSAMVLHRRTGTALELHPFDPDAPTRIVPLESVRAIDRILWASQ